MIGCKIGYGCKLCSLTSFTYGLLSQSRYIYYVFDANWSWRCWQSTFNKLNKRLLYQVLDSSRVGTLLYRSLSSVLWRAEKTWDVYPSKEKLLNKFSLFNIMVNDLLIYLQDYKISQLTDDDAIYTLKWVVLVNCMWYYGRWFINLFTRLWNFTICKWRCCKEICHALIFFRTKLDNIHKSC